MKKDSIILASAQFDPHIFDTAYNLEKVLSLTKKAKEDLGCDLIVFPEAALTGYCMRDAEETEKAAISKNGTEISALKTLSKKLTVSILVGAIEKDGEKLYNSVFFIEPDGKVFTYRKSHLPYLGVDRFVTEGDISGGVFDTRFGKVGILVCYELRFPEVARRASLAGARLLLQPTNLPLGGESHPDFLTRARACENKVHFLSCNRTGVERGFTFIGRSQIVDIWGNVMAEAGDSEEIISATLDLRESDDKDIIGTPKERELYLFRDRRWGQYDNLSARPAENGFVAVDETEFG